MYVLIWIVMEKIMNNIKVVILDSGINKKHPIFSDINIIEYIRNTKNGTWEIGNEILQSGHGTAVSSALIKKFSNLSLISFKIFSNEENEVEPDVLIDALNYIYKNIDCDVINISLGVYIDIPELKDICDRLKKRNTIIVAAFCNEGLISYPAAYDSVIGVDSTYSLNNLTDYIYVENSMVNVGMMACNQRLAWNESEYVLLHGNSFLAPLITAKICDYLHQGFSAEKIKEVLSEKAKNNITFYYPEAKDFEMFDMRSVAIFPFNKETKSLIKYSNMLSFEIKAIYDSKYSGNLGLSMINTNNTEYVIQNIDKCNWTEIDTFIIGHCDKLDKTVNYDYKREILSECKKRNINVFSFDTIDIEEHTDYSSHIYVPHISRDKNNSNKFGKTYHISSPVLGVVGTSSRQGKFTLQLELRKIFQQNGYKVGQLSSEPEGCLFGMDSVYPYGYNGTVTISGLENIECVNSIMHNIDLKNPDIILVGSQSGTSTVSFNNLSTYNISTMEYLLGAKPDAIILCINFHDTIDTIKRTIKFVESLVDGTVIALSLFPLGFDSQWSIFADIPRKIDDIRLMNFCEELRNKLNLPCEILGNENSIEKIYNKCIEFFSN